MKCRSMAMSDGRGIFCILAACALLMTAAPMIGWSSGPGEIWRSSQFGWNDFAGHPFSPRYLHTSVVFHDKMWVIGGQDSAGNRNDVWYSSDGATWMEATASAAFSPRYGHTSVVFNSQMWVIGGRDDAGVRNDVWRSSDGVTWTLAAAPAEFAARYYHTSVVFNDGSGDKIWVIGGYDGTNFRNDVWSSADGVTWAQAPATAVFSARYGHASAVFNNQMWVISGYDSVSGKNDVWHSSDGATWIRATASAAFSARDHFTCLAFNNRLWVIGGNIGGSEVWSTLDGATWTSATATAAFSTLAMHSSVVFNNQMWVLGGFISDDKSDVWRSDDGATWTQSGAGFSSRSEHSSVVFDNKMWIIGGLDNYRLRHDVWCSSDGVKWVSATGAAAFSERRYQTSVAFGGRMWVIGGYDAGGYKNDVWYSSDGVTWTSATLSAAFSARYGHTSVVFNDGGGDKMWVIGGYDGVVGYRSDVWSSSDGVTWTQAPATAPFPGRLTHKSVVFNNGTGARMWVIGGLDAAGKKNDVWYSSDGATWTAATLSAEFSPRYWHSCAVFNDGTGDKMWIFCGKDTQFRSDAWSSADGTSWTQATAGAPFSARYEITGLAFNGNLWVLGGWNGIDTCNDIWRTSDGASWTQTWGSAAFTPRLMHTSVAYNGMLWVMGGTNGFEGNLNDVWFSADGVAWHLATKTAAFYPRASHASAVFNNRMWILGGNAGGSEVWSSSDGAAWTSATLSAFPDRTGGACQVFNNGTGDKLWMLAGTGSGSGKDVWYSSDGATWNFATLSAAFSARRNFASAVFNNELWIMAGTNGVADVWHSGDGASWSQATAAPGFQACEGATCLPFGGKMWFQRGAWPCTSALWSSSNGTTWTKVSAAAAYSRRVYHASVSLNNKMWVIGGYDGASITYNDAWQCGSGSAAAVSDASLDFGTRGISLGPSQPSTVTLSNLYPQSWAPLNVASVTIQNDATGAFALASAATTEALLVGDSRDYAVTFDPGAEGVATANLVIQSDDPTSPTIVIPLSGTGILSAPSNDLFSSATLIAGPSGSVLGNNSSATKEPGEPNHAGNAGGASVWWTWTAPLAGTYAFDTHGSNFNTLLAVYTGASVGSLTLVASNDNDGSPNGNSGLVFTAQAGVQYSIAVDGFGGAAGSIALNWALRRVLTVASWVPGSGVSIAISPLDIGGQGSGATQLTRAYNDNTTVTLTAPFEAANGYVFYRWLLDGANFPGNQSQTVQVLMNANRTMTAIFHPDYPILTVASQNPTSGINVFIVPTDIDGKTRGTTLFTAQYLWRNMLTLTAPPYLPNGWVFSKWLKDGADFPYNTQRDVLCSLDTDHTMTVIFAHPYNTSLLTVASANPSTGAVVSLYPADKNNQTTGTTPFIGSYAPNSLVTLTARGLAPNGYVFWKWLRDGAEFPLNTRRDVLCSMAGDHTMTAVYRRPLNISLLTVNSSNPDSGAVVSIYPADNYNQTSGTTQFVASYPVNSMVMLTARGNTPNGHVFWKWQRDGADFPNNTQRAVLCSMGADHTMTAVYRP
ncbi:MAG: choice-of-anchor D domain-containing protein [Candidatus Sumerlaeota bacterium]|nr:choice-of-anchor D domain-containing protein [Candidatus Sumerlaeota bacterium]